MQVKNNPTQHSAAVDPSKQAHKAQVHPNKPEGVANSDAATGESERVAHNAKEFNKGLAPVVANKPGQVAENSKVDDVSESVKVEAFKRERDRMVKA